jgi:hypothetical protein
MGRIERLRAVTAAVCPAASEGPASALEDALDVRVGSRVALSLQK